jgi:hypothetical protein
MTAIPRNVGELLLYAPEMVPSMARRTLLRLQQGVFHSNDQLPDQIQDIWAFLLKEDTLAKFDISRYPTTPEHGFTAFVSFAICNIIKNSLGRGSNKERFFPIVSSNPEDKSGISENYLPSDEYEDPLEDAMRHENNKLYASYVSDFVDFIGVYMADTDSAEYYQECAGLLQHHSIADIGEMFDLSPTAVLQLRGSMKSMLYLFLYEKSNPRI